MKVKSCNILILDKGNPQCLLTIILVSLMETGRCYHPVWGHKVSQSYCHCDPGSGPTILNLGQMPLPWVGGQEQGERERERERERRERDWGVDWGREWLWQFCSGSSYPFLLPRAIPPSMPSSWSCIELHFPPLNPILSAFSSTKLPISFYSLVLPLLVVQSCPPFLNLLRLFWQWQGPSVGEVKCMDHHLHLPP